MERDLAAFATSGATLAERLRVAGALARAVVELHARGKVHGRLHPGAVIVLAGGEVVLAPPSPGGGLLARAGWDAPEVARGARASRRSDAFSVGALAWLALAGRAPFAAAEPIERVRQVLFEDAPPVRLHAPGVTIEVESAVARLLERAPRRRGELRELAERAGATSTSTSSSTTTATPTATPTSPSTYTALRAASAFASATWRSLDAAARSAGRALRPAVARLARLRALGPLERAGLAAIPLVLLALLLLRDRDAALAREVAQLLEAGDVAAARLRVETAARHRPGDAIVEKLRGDVACARGASGECLRRYRVALAARPALREDGSLRANTRRLLGREQTCGTRRAAAQLLGELRDPAALPALEVARRSGGFLAFLCTGDSIDRAITATRAELPR